MRCVHANSTQERRSNSIFKMTAVFVFFFISSMYEVFIFEFYSSSL